MYAARPVADCKKEQFSILRFRLISLSLKPHLQTFSSLRGHVHKSKTFQRGVSVLLTLVKAELAYSKADSKPSISSIRTSVSFIGTDGS